jgi:soluble lytic murein transglycosylase-like protein
VRPALVLAVIEVESAYGLLEVSSVGCLGLMQLNKRTAAAVAMGLGMGRPELRRIEHNVTVGTAYLRTVFDLYGRWDFGLTAYNKGPGLFRKQRYRISAYAKAVLKRQAELESELLPEVAETP